MRKKIGGDQFSSPFGFSSRQNISRRDAARKRKGKGAGRLFKQAEEGHWTENKSRGGGRGKDEGKDGGEGQRSQPRSLYLVVLRST